MFLKSNVVADLKIKININIYILENFSFWKNTEMKLNIVFLIVLMNIGIFVCKCEYTGRFNSKTFFFSHVTLFCDYSHFKNFN